MNIEIREETQFKQQMQKVLDMWLQTKKVYATTEKWWEYCEIKIRATAKRYSIQRGQNDRNKENLLLKQSMKAKQAIRPENEVIDKIKQELGELTERRLNGIKIRSRAQWSEKGEKPTKYFHGLESKIQAAATIRKIKTE